MEKEMNYAKAMAEIEAILAKLADENTDIDTLAEEVGRAAQLIKLCRQKLHKAQTEVEKILVQEDQAM